MMSPAASAWELPAPLNIINEKVFDGDWSIADKQGSPKIVWHRSRTISAWIDIIGFRNECNINGTRYVNGQPKNFAIVRRGAKYRLPKKCVFISFTSTSWVIDSGSTTKAVQRTRFRYNERVCTILGCHWKKHTDYKTVSYSAVSPKTFNNSIDDYEITITSYNNSVTPYTLIHVPDRWNIIKQSVEYKTDTASWYNLTGLVKKNDRGTEHVRFLNESGFTIDENETITRRAEYFVINEAPLNWSMLNISVFTPYIEKTDSVCNITIYNSKPTDFITEKTLMIFIGILLAFFIGICIASGRIKL